ncbi:MAG: amidase [Dehalococcoidia bacterium]
MDAFAWLDATAQAALVRKREVTPLELLDAAVARIERLNPQLNAVVTPMFDQARRAASVPLPDGPFTGVPFLLKDLTAAYAGVPMTSGSLAMKDFVPLADSELVARHKRAGFVIAGKTNTPEFGLLPTTEPALFGPARNPWALDRTTGGSSGGSAAAVASGMVPAAHGNDGGGSIRIPASCCGLFGFKPSRGRNPLAIDPSGLQVEHALTRSVRDSAAILDATQGAQRGDPFHAPPPARPYVEELCAGPGKLRIAFTSRALGATTLHEDCVAAVRDAAKLCADLGHNVEEAAPALLVELISNALNLIWRAGAAAQIDAVPLLAGRVPAEGEFEPLTRALAQQGRGYSAPELFLAMGMLQIAAQSMSAFYQQYDIWLTPTLGSPPVPLGTFDSTPDDPASGFAPAEAFVPFTALINATGQPAMSVPLYWNAEGLPIGAHFVAPFGDEPTLFRLAAQLEEARPWADRRPPVSA